MGQAMALCRCVKVALSEQADGKDPLPTGPKFLAKQNSDHLAKTVRIWPEIWDMARSF